MRKVIILRETPGGTLRTRELQEAIDRCAEEGGGQVRLTAGLYLSGTVYLKSGVELYLDAGAVLRGSPDRKDYSNRCPRPTKVEGVPHWYNALIAATDARDVGILGEGVLDGADCPDPEGEQGFRGPHTVFFFGCENIRVEGVTLVRSACYHLMFECCRKIRVRGVSIHGGQDGFRFGECEDAEIRECDVRSGDDCIGGSGNRDVRIYDTALNTPGGSVLQFSSRGLHVKNCVFWGPGLYPAVFKEDKRYSVPYAAVCAGLDYEYARGEESDDWLFEDVDFENAELLFRWEKDLYGRKNIPLHHVTFDRVRAVNLALPSVIDAAEGDPLEISIRNSEFTRAEEDPRGEGLFLKGRNFRSLRMENVALRGFKEDPLALENVGQVELKDVRREAVGTETCLPREVIPGGGISLMKPAEAGEEFRGPLTWVPRPKRAPRA